MMKQRKGTSEAVLWLLVSAAGAVMACASPQLEKGTNTNWFETCNKDEDCTALGKGAVCEQNQCVVPAPATGGSCGVAGGTCTNTASSPDGGAPSGSTTSTMVAPISGSLSGVAATDQGWIAVGSTWVTQNTQRSLVATSGDATHWAISGSPIAPQNGAPSGTFGLVVNGNGTTVALGGIGSVGNGPSTDLIALKRPDGDWQYQTADWPGVSQILYGNGVFIVNVGTDQPGSVVSSDDLHWSDGVYAERYAFADGRFTAGSFSAGTSPMTIRTSTDGLTWSTATPMSQGITDVLALTDGGNEVLGVGTACGPTDGTDCPHPASVFFSGPKGTPPADLTAEPAPWTDTQPSVALAASDSRAVVVLELATEPGSQIWARALPTGSGPWQNATVPTDWVVRNMAYGSGVFVIVREHLFGSGAQLPLIATSTDGLDWKEATISQ